MRSLVGKLSLVITGNLTWHHNDSLKSEKVLHVCHFRKSLLPPIIITKMDNSRDILGQLLEPKNWNYKIFTRILTTQFFEPSCNSSLGLRSAKTAEICLSQLA